MIELSKSPACAWRGPLIRGPHCWHRKLVKKSVNVLESTAFLTLYAIQKLFDSLFLALCVWCFKTLVILWHRAWICLVRLNGGLDFRGLDRVPKGSVAMCSTKACNMHSNWYHDIL